MGIFAGAMTVRRFKVEGELGEGWREMMRERLNEYAFQEPPQGQGKEEVEGWVRVQNLLDTDFEDFNLWLMERYAVFALRVDKKRLPAKLFKATLEKRVQAWCVEKGLERCPSTVKTDMKEALEAEWLSRTLPTVAVTECAWDVHGGMLLLHGMSTAVTERFRKRFHQSFGLTLTAWSPLDYLDDSALAQRLFNVAPSMSLTDHGASE